MLTYTPLLNPTEDSVRVFLDPAEAIKLVDRVRRVSFFIRSSVDLVTELDAQGHTAQAYTGMGGNIPVSAAVVRRMLIDLAAFNERKTSREEKAGRVEVTRLGNCLFFG